MKRAWLALAGVMGCLACSETERNLPGPGAAGDAGAESAGGSSTTGGSGKAGMDAAGKMQGGGAGGTAGRPNGGAGGAGFEAGGATDAGSGGEGGAGGGMEGMAGAGPVEGCNQLELVEMNPACSTLGAPMPEQGGTLLEGTYALVAYEMPVCLQGLEQALRITQTAADTFDVETVTNLGGARANSTFVRQALVLRSTSSCGAEEVDEPYGYTAFEDQGVAHLRLANQGTFTYRRIGD